MIDGIPRIYNWITLFRNMEALLELLDQVEDAIGVDNDTVCDKTTQTVPGRDATEVRKTSYISPFTMHHVKTLSSTGIHAELALQSMLLLKLLSIQ